MDSVFLTAGEEARAQTVGWIVLIVAIVALVLAAMAATAIAGEALFDFLARRIPAYRPAWWSILIIGVILIIVGYIVSSAGLAILGGVALVINWRISDRHV